MIGSTAVPHSAERSAPPPVSPASGLGLVSAVRITRSPRLGVASDRSWKSVAVAPIEAFGQGGGKRPAVGVAGRFGNAGNKELTAAFAAFWPAYFQIGRLSQKKLVGCTCLGAILGYSNEAASKLMRPVAVPPFPPIAAFCRSAAPAVPPRHWISHSTPSSSLDVCSQVKVRNRHWDDPRTKGSIESESFRIFIRKAACNPSPRG